MRVVKEGKLIHTNRAWRRGRKLTQRLDKIIQVTKMTLRDIAAYYSEVPTYVNPHSQMLAMHVEDLSKVIQGKRNTERYVRALEDSWKLPIEEIRAIYREDKAMEARGESWTILELRDFADRHRARINSLEVA
jgi:hypothetical protein